MTNLFATEALAADHRRRLLSASRERVLARVARTAQTTRRAARAATLGRRLPRHSQHAAAVDARSPQGNLRPCSQ